MSRNHKPINRCRIRGCPVVGYWEDGETCPMHRDDFDSRPPTLQEQWTADNGDLS
jgi:hypothetical protein